jgi:predicted Ser/Thr protein kinase
LPQQNATNKAVIMKMKMKRRKGEVFMTNDVIKKYIGKECKISTGSLGVNIAGKILDVNENWIEVETKKGNELINAEYVQSIKVF